MRTNIRKQHRYLFCNITGLIDLTKATICLFAAFSFFCLAACSAHIHRSTINNGKFVPAENKILMFIGQDSDTVADYHKEVPEDKIEGVTLYTSLLSASPEKTLPAIHSLGNWGAGDTDFQKTLTQFPSASLAIGLSMAQCQHDHLFQIAQGHYDESLDVFINFIQSIAPRPVFLRIGYEFDGPWNCYTPTPYKEAYRHIVKRFRARNIQNVAFVWQSAVWPDPRIAGDKAEYYNHRNAEHFSSWYPGNDVVDWVSMSVFYRGLSQWQSAPPDNPQHLQSALLNFARQHGKPVMIAESSPQGFNISKLTSSTIQQFDPQSVSAEDIWQTWYQPFFDFIYANRDIIRAVAYINTHWESQPMWHCALFSKAGTDDCANGYWGDARVQANPDIKQRWLEHSLDDNIWVQATQ